MHHVLEGAALDPQRDVVVGQRERLVEAGLGRFGLFQKLGLGFEPLAVVQLALQLAGRAQRHVRPRVQAQRVDADVQVEVFHAAADFVLLEVVVAEQVVGRPCSRRII